MKEIIRKIESRIEELEEKISRLKEAIKILVGVDIPRKEEVEKIPKKRGPYKKKAEKGRKLSVDKIEDVRLARKFLRRKSDEDKLNENQQAAFDSTDGIQTQDLTDGQKEQLIRMYHDLFEGQGRWSKKRGK